MAKDDAFPYSCEIHISLPTRDHADQLKRVMEVDTEIGEKVKKSIDLVENAMRVHIKATEAKLLRVVVSTFYDYLTVALKCIQEFDG
mmetsp:Transcript_25086/g.58376  ORF Transcript_25086/g.58376 Transcript_25086/m.58376 type:complete len:87 (+) Transcript_25086:77-337(+)